MRFPSTKTVVQVLRSAVHVARGKFKNRRKLQNLLTLFVNLQALQEIEMMPLKRSQLLIYRLY